MNILGMTNEEWAVYQKQCNLKYLYLDKPNCTAKELSSKWKALFPVRLWFDYPLTKAGGWSKKPCEFLAELGRQLNVTTVLYQKPNSWGGSHSEDLLRCRVIVNAEQTIGLKGDAYHTLLGGNSKEEVMATMQKIYELYPTIFKNPRRLRKPILWEQERRIGL